MMTTLGSENDQSDPAHERLDACLKNLFVQPTKNIESAFEVILGLIKDQSTKLDQVVEEKDGLSADLQRLKTEHNNLLKSHDKATVAIDELRQDIATLTFNFLGDAGGKHLSDDEIVDSVAGSDEQVEEDVSIEQPPIDNVDTESERGEQEVDNTAEPPPVDPQSNAEEGETCVSDSGKADDTCAADITRVESDSAAKEENSQETSSKGAALGWGHVGRIGLGIAKAKVAKHRTVVARLDRLEQLLVETNDHQVTETAVTPQESLLEEMSSRIHAVETFVHGFGQVAEPTHVADEDMTAAENGIVDETDSASCTSSSSQMDGTVETVTREDDTDQNSSESMPPPSRCDSGQSLGRKADRDTRTGLSIDDLAQQMTALREKIQEQQTTGPNVQHSTSIGPEELQKQVAELVDGLQKQVAELVASDDKVSSEDFETKIQEIHAILNTHCTAESIDAAVSSTSDALAEVKKQMAEQLCNLDTTKIDKDAFEQRLEQIDCNLKSLLEQESSKQRLAISANAEKIDNDLTDIKSILNSQQDTMTRLRDEPYMEMPLKEDDVNARIQQATDALRKSLEERLDELRSIESEMEVVATKLAEKPSQDQIDVLIRDLEKRMGHDQELQRLLAYVKTGALPSTTYPFGLLF